MNKLKISLSFFFSLAIFTSCTAQDVKSSAPTIISATPQQKKIFQGSDVVWAFDFIDANHIIFTEKSGPIKILDTTTGKVATISNTPVSDVHGQGGMMDVVLHPDFKKNALVYISYAVKEKDAFETRISRAKLEKNKFTDVQVLFTGNSHSNKGEHFGSRIVFDREGHMFFSAGERGNRDDAQKLSQANGKIHRLMDDGSIPKDNPFVNDKDAIASIWSYGHRNPQGLYYDFDTKTLWESEHGPKGGDEINIIQKGKNYGWPIITYGREYYGPKIGSYAKEGLEQPFYFYVPSIATCGLTLFHGDLYSGSLVLTHLNRIVIKDKKVVREERLLNNANERIRDVRTGPDDMLYISTDSGKIIQLKL